MIGLMYPLQSVLDVRMTRNHEAIVQGIQQFVGRKYDYTPMNDIEQQYANYPAETVERIRNQVSLSALKGLIIHMGTLKEGRKSLILVSEGYTNMLPPQMREPERADAGVGNPPAIRRPAPTRSPKTARELRGDDRHAAGPARRLRRGEPQNIVALRGRSARPGGLRVRRERAVASATRPIGST